MHASVELLRMLQFSGYRVKSKSHRAIGQGLDRVFFVGGFIDEPHLACMGDEAALVRLGGHWSWLRGTGLHELPSRRISDLWAAVLTS